MECSCLGGEKRALDSLEAELQRVVNHTSCSLGSESRSSVRSVISVFNHSHLSCTNFVLFYLFWDIVSLSGPGWSGTHCVDKADLRLRHLPSMSLEYWN